MLSDCSRHAECYVVGSADRPRRSCRYAHTHRAAIRARPVSAAALGRAARAARPEKSQRSITSEGGVPPPRGRRGSQTGRPTSGPNKEILKEFLNGSTNTRTKTISDAKSWPPPVLPPPGRSQRSVRSEGGHPPLSPWAHELASGSK